MENIFDQRGIGIPEGSENQVILVARMVRDHYFPRRSRNFPDWILVLAILKIVEAYKTATPDEMFEMMMSPASIESAELRRVIHGAIAACRNHKIEWNEAGIFNGAKQHEFEKLGAMTAYFAARGQNICRRKLNALYFYADFANYYLHNVSISGARYVRVCQGPMQEYYERMLDTMVAKGIVEMNKSGGQVTKLSDSIIDNLTNMEITTLHWVLSTFDSLSCHEINEHSHRESSHRFTRRGDYIPYEYARLVKNLPQPSAT